MSPDRDDHLAGWLRHRRGHGPFGPAVVHFDRVGSTNDVALELARRGAPHGTVVWADAQTAGRGRWGRSWVSPPGGVYLSVVLRSAAPTSPHAGLLPAMAAVAATEAIAESSGVTVAIRWPNDLVVEGLKLGGVLCDASFAGQRLDFAVVGVGIDANVRSEDLPEAIRPLATSLAVLAGGPVDRLALAGRLVERLAARWASLEAGAAAELLAAWRRRSWGATGLLVRARSRTGETLTGVTEGLTDDGGLLVRVADEDVRTLRAEDVEVVHPAAARDGEENEDYFAAVERAFVALRGAPLFITPSEWHLVHRWYRTGIPLRVVREGLERAFERRKPAARPIRRLSYCRQSVEAAYRRFREAVGGARPARKAAVSADEIATAVETYLERTERELREAAAAHEGSPDLASACVAAADAVAAWRRSDPAVRADAARLESELERLDETLVAAAVAALTEEERSATRQAAASVLETYRERMPEEVYRSALDSAYRKRVRARFGLPSLSLYNV